jgi:nucleoside 2-deoxyribosyltransferase
MDQKKVVYIAGPITGVERYWEAFEHAEDILLGLGYIPLSPAHLPNGMTNAQYARMCLAQIDSADVVLLLPNYTESFGARLEREYCCYIDKPCIAMKQTDLFGETIPTEVAIAWIKHDLEEVLSR